MNKTAVSALCAMFLLAPLAGVAQTNSVAIDDPEATLISDLIIIAPTEGPAWWRVSRGDSVVWILGMPVNATPVGMTWDRKALERRLKGANALLLPARGSVGFTPGKGDKAALLRSLPGVRWTNGNVEKDMTPALAARFASARARLKRPVGRYSTGVPAIAFVMLWGDHHQAAKLQRGAAEAAVTAAAKRLKVPQTRAASFEMGTMKFADLAPERPEAAACFDALLDATEVPVERYRAAAAGWARGDLAAATSAPRDPLSICENRLFNQGASRRGIDAQVAAIEAALTRPGKAVAISPLRMLLADEGVLDRLAARGYHIVYPTTLDEGVD